MVFQRNKLTKTTFFFFCYCLTVAQVQFGEEIRRAGKDFQLYKLLTEASGSGKN